MPNNPKKYHPFPKISLPDRTWPQQHLSSAPVWCSVDLRDGNQALINPMTMDQKLRLFKLLCDLGFKEIEVGFPAASTVEYQFVRRLIEENLIPDDVHIQVLTQAREHLINTTIESIQGAPNSIVHLYNSTSVAQRRDVFKKSKEEIIDIALQGVRWIKAALAKSDVRPVLEYSPESFTGTELDYSLDICNRVIDEWDPDGPMIINLPATVELCMPNVYADMIEYASRHLHRRDQVILSCHTHNDRGTGTAATELALLAGAQRVEGTLFGNGERTGNLDIVTVALNMLTHGIDPKLDLSDLPYIMGITDACTNLPVHERHPYAGSLVFTAFSGSHQDAINKGMAAHSLQKDPKWEVPYLSIDPSDIGKSYEAIIRINSQSGKGGVAYILEQEFQCALPKAMHVEVSKLVQRVAEVTEKEVDPQQIWSIFSESYLELDHPLSFGHFKMHSDTQQQTTCTLDLHYQGQPHQLSGTGNGPIDACKQALLTILPDFSIASYHEHSLSSGSESNAICYIQVQQDGRSWFGVGIDPNITTASVRALLSALNRLAAHSE